MITYVLILFHWVAWMPNTRNKFVHIHECPADDAHTQFHAQVYRMRCVRLQTYVRHSIFAYKQNT